MNSTYKLCSNITSTTTSTFLVLISKLPLQTRSFKIHVFGTINLNYDSFQKY